MVCHDGSPAADAILAPARAWARSLNASIVLMHAHPALDLRAAQESTDAIGRAHEFLGPGTCLEEVVHSFAAGAIRELAHELDASLIAMSTHGRSALAPVAMGKSAAWVTRESPCPVLTIRPSILCADHMTPAGQAEPSSPIPGALLIDALMPTWDTSIAEHLIVRADPFRTFGAARDLDFRTCPLAAPRGLDVGARRSGPPVPSSERGAAATRTQRRRRASRMGDPWRAAWA